MAAAMPKLVNLPAPKPYWNDPSESPTNFRAWWSRLNNWLALTNATLPDEHQLSDVCKNRYLYQLLGEEGGRQFSTQPAVDAITTATYADFSKNVANYFQKSISIVRARHDFGTRMQSSHESVSDYLTELRALAVDCNFQDKENEHLATQLAIGCCSSEAKKELLRKKELNLDDFVAVIEAIESASSDLSVIQGNSSDAKGAKIGASKNFQRKQKSGVRSDMRPPGKGAQAKSSSKSGPTKPCAGCGQLTHKFKSAHCPAVNVQCSYCSNVGHFERCCFKKQEANGKQVGPSGPKRNVKSLHQKCASGEHAAGYAKFNCTMFVVSGKGFVPIEAEIDTGSDATTITYSQYRTHFSAQPLKPLREPLRNFDNTSITGVLGHFGANVSINGRMQHARIFVTNDACSPVVGKNLIMPLKLLAANPAVHALKRQSATKIFNYASYISAQFPALLSAKLGCYPDFQHHITLSADAKPSAKCMRPVPLARRDAVACEVQTLEENDVWEKVDKSLWQHQMVTVLKPDGSYRITTDLSPLNRFVVPDRYPLPNIKELFLELKGATVFSKLDIKKAFFHIMLDEASRDLTTTLTHQGLYRYKRLPMGLKDSAAVCQRLISQTLSECEGTRAYIDDIVVYGRDRVEHDRNLHAVLHSPTADQRKSSKYVRWAERLSLFEYKLEYRKGTDNCPADALSRLSLKAKELAVPDVHDTIVMKRITESGLPLSDIKAATSADPLLLKLMQIIRTRWPTKSQLSADMLPFYSIRHALSVEQGYITREDDRIIVPASLRKRLLQLAHQGHPGIVRFKRKLRETFWWPAMDRDIEHVVRHCGPCQASEKSASPPNVPVTHVSPPKRAWERIGIDIIGPFDVAPAHQRYVVVVMDHFSRFPEVLLTNDITFARILRWLSELFARYGHPAMHVRDNGPQFTSHEFAAFLHDRDIAHYNTAVYNPQENGIVENFNRTLAHGVQAFASAHTPWHTGILHILSNFRATAPAPGDLSPAEKFFNRPMRLNFQPILRKGDNQALSKSAACTQPTNAATLPRNRGPFKVGDKVLVRLPSTRKGRSPFSGPLDVVKVLGNWSYFLSDGQKWNARKLKRFHDPSQQWATVTVPPQAHLQEPFPRRSERLNKGRPPDRYSPGP